RYSVGKGSSMNRPILTLGVLAAMLSLVGETSAARRGAWGRTARPAYLQPAARQAPLEMGGPRVRVAPPSSFSPYQSTRDNYPKYNCELHSRHFQNTGIPTGDSRIRGNGF